MYENMRRAEESRLLTELWMVLITKILTSNGPLSDRKGGYRRQGEKFHFQDSSAQPARASQELCVHKQEHCPLSLILPQNIRPQVDRPLIFIRNIDIFVEDMVANALFRSSIFTMYIDPNLFLPINTAFANA